jgi:hypothetical protein
VEAILEIYHNEKSLERKIENDSVKQYELSMQLEDVPAFDALGFSRLVVACWRAISHAPSDLLRLRPTRSDPCPNRDM